MGLNGHFEIDRRPLPVVLFSRLKRQFWIAVFFVLFAVVLDFAPPVGLSQEGWSTVCIFGLCGLLWATSTLPLAVTSLLAIALVPMLDILGARETYAYFGSKVVFFILGAFMLAAALIATGLSQRFATLFVRRFGGTSRRLIMAVFALCAVASTMMSGHAVAVMVFPIVRDIERSLNLQRATSKMGRALYFALMWGCIIGGSLTVLGGGRAPLAIGILEEASGERASIGFLEYVHYSWPMVLVLVLGAGAFLKTRFIPEIESIDVAQAELERRLHAMGKITPKEIAVGLVVVITIVLWALAGDSYGLANIAICSIAALFAIGALDWDTIQSHVNWGIVVMYGGAICLGGVMEQTGAAAWLMQQVISDSATSTGAMMLGFAIVAAIFTEFMSNSAVVAMLLPPALSFAGAHDIDLRAMTMVVVLPSNFAFMFPISTPVTAIAWSAGFFTPRQVARTGLLLHLAAWSAMALLIFVYWPSIGLL
jgi:solute carrier family 13 (sodium-dependent dicarboxylate transporter), member 2/3/5